MPFERIRVDPARMGGLPTIRDTRVTGTMVLGQTASGCTIDEVLTSRPTTAGRGAVSARGPCRPAQP